MLLRVVESSCAKFETGQTFSSMQTDAMMLGVVESVACGSVNEPIFLSN